MLAYLVELASHYSKQKPNASELRDLLYRAQNSFRTDDAPTSRQSQVRLDTDEVQELIAGYVAGRTVSELARQYGIHRTTVSEILKREGVTFRLAGLTPSQVAEASALYEAGWSLVRLGTKFNVDGTTVWRALVAKGTVMRSPNAPHNIRPDCEGMI